MPTKSEAARLSRRTLVVGAALTPIVATDPAAAQRCPVIASAAALEALGPAAARMARLVHAPEPAGFAAAAQALLAAPAAARPLLDRAERHARSRTPEAVLTNTLFLLRAAMLRASLASPQETIA